MQGVLDPLVGPKKSLYRRFTRSGWRLHLGSGEKSKNSHSLSPVHASWLNQIEIYFSIVQCKVLTPNDFPCREAVAERLANFERYFESIARPFEWKFTRADLNALIARMRNRWAQSQPWKLAV